MKLSLLILTVYLLNFCNRKPDIIQPENALIIKTIDRHGNGIQSNIVYESRDCEYDFNEPVKVSTNAAGIAVLNLPKDYIQFYSEGFLHESYKCFFLNGSTHITVYADSIPTYIQTSPYAEINWFVNSSGDCSYEPVIGNIVVADEKGRATLFLPMQETYKIQVGSTTKCFQPDQNAQTLTM